MLNKTFSRFELQDVNDFTEIVNFTWQNKKNVLNLTEAPMDLKQYLRYWKLEVSNSVKPNLIYWKNWENKYV